MGSADRSSTTLSARFSFTQSSCFHQVTWRPWHPFSARYSFCSTCPVLHVPYRRRWTAQWVRERQRLTIASTATIPQVTFSFSPDNDSGGVYARWPDHYYWIAGIAQWLERRTRDRRVASSNPCRSGGRVFFSGVNFLCWLLFRYPFHPRVTAVARKRPRSFCQKCRWQVTAKHAYTLRMWLWMVYTERAEMAAISCGTTEPCQRCEYTTSVDIQKRAIKSYSLM